MVIDRPRIGSAGNVPRRRRHDIAATGSHVDAGTERRIVCVLGNDVRYLNTVGTGKQHMLAAASGERAPGRRDFVLAFEHSEALVAAVTRINIDDHEPISCNTQVGFGYAQLPPHFYDAALGRGGAQAVWRIVSNGCLAAFLPHSLPQEQAIWPLCS